MKIKKPTILPYTLLTYFTYLLPYFTYMLAQFYRAVHRFSVKVKKEDIYLHPDLGFWT